MRFEIFMSLVYADINTTPKLSSHSNKNGHNWSDLYNLINWLEAWCILAFYLWWQVWLFLPSLHLLYVLPLQFPYKSKSFNIKWVLIGMITKMWIERAKSAFCYHYFHSFCSATLWSVPAVNSHPLIKNKNVSFVQWCVVHLNLRFKMYTVQ